MWVLTLYEMLKKFQEFSYCQSLAVVIRRGVRLSLQKKHTINSLKCGKFLLFKKMFAGLLPTYKGSQQALADAEACSENTHSDKMTHISINMRGNQNLY